jgi:hypothetical protein
MNISRDPDRVIAEWLADGATELPSPARRAISASVRTTQQRESGMSWRSDLGGVRLLVLAGVVAALALTLGVGAGAMRLVRPQPIVLPAPTVTAAPTGTPATTGIRIPPCYGDATVSLAGQNPVTLPGTMVSLDYSVPVELDLDMGAAPGVVGFGTPLWWPHRPSGDGAQGNLLDSHGVLVTDVSLAVRHGSLSEQPRLGTDARTFLRDLDIAFPYQGGVIDFQVDDVAPERLAGLPAWSARVTVPDLSPPMWSHIDSQLGGERGCAVEFGLPNRVWVMDVGSSIVLVQAWASDEDALAAWLPDATRLADTFRLRPATP